ncbi:cellulose synthase catalytic subunit [Scytonema hofmannii PCC 7110]|uniref:Cellulose synthase catalytic subunit n=1 Tax=Scytonema hofmannii PCC 7110 TaxID=128403 RepID=A0A139X4J5_9CYAN|nr:glycosyltransferase [Scytonema hofmannii]KYC39604.1 cellulose synthase catalytic subunit [Scytonema hofmannii PCC 7110]
MIITKLSKYSLKLVRQRGFQVHRATFFLLSIFVLFGIVIAAWFAGDDRISHIFAEIHEWQKHPPIWLTVPIVPKQYLLVPTVLLLLSVLAIMKISPQPQAWSRRFIVGILLCLTLRYVLWRSLSTLNLANPLVGVFSLGLFLFEMFAILNTIIQLFLLMNFKDRRQEATRKSVAVVDEIYKPSVDILIPTYSEPGFILRRTIIGCQALDYSKKKIYLLDDTKRPEMQKLAKELGCEYVTRPDNRYAKAGNLNHAISKTNGELIVVFDADFVPTTNFLVRTVGFFQDKNVALVQTPQTFYNADPIGRNLGLENILTPDEEGFYRQIQPIRDAAGGVVCCGTSFVVRRSALESVGGFVTESLSEDYFTGIRLSAKGYNVIYLNEQLSAGLAAENIAAYVTQRLRWSRGTLQAFFIKSNPLTIPGLTLIQRLAHLEGLLNHSSSIARVYFLLTPLAYLFLGVIPIHATAVEIIYFYLPLYIINLAVFSWLNYRSRSAFLSDIYSLLLCFPLALNQIKVMINPFDTGFKVTPKGETSEKYYYNWQLAIPLIILFIATLLGLCRNLGIFMFDSSWTTTVSQELDLQVKGIGIGWYWSAYNLITIGISLLVLLDAPKLDRYEWFNLRRVVRLQFGEQSLWGVSRMISEGGVEVALTQKPPFNLVENKPVKLEIAEENLLLDAQVVCTGLKDEFPTVRVMFESVSLLQQRQLVEMLFCRPGQWKRNNVPGELGSLLLILKILLKSRFLFNRKLERTPLAIAKI